MVAASTSTAGCPCGAQTPSLSAQRAYVMCGLHALRHNNIPEGWGHDSAPGDRATSREYPRLRSNCNASMHLHLHASFRSKAIRIFQTWVYPPSLTSAPTGSVRCHRHLLALHCYHQSSSHTCDFIKALHPLPGWILQGHGSSFVIRCLNFLQSLVGADKIAWRLAAGVHRVWLCSPGNQFLGNLHTPRRSRHVQMCLGCVSLAIGMHVRPCQQRVTDCIAACGGMQRALL